MNDKLIHNEAFVEFLEGVNADREANIRALHEADVGKIQQISGRILQCDEILTAGGWQEILKRRKG